MQKETFNSRIADDHMDSKDTRDSSNPNTADLSALRIHRDRETKIRSYKWLKVIPWILIPALIVVSYFYVKEYLSRGTEVDVTNVRLIKGSSARAMLSASGYVVAQRSSSVASKATGRVVLMAVEEGDNVVVGQLLAKVESDDMEASLELAQANLKYSIFDSIEAAAQYQRNLKFKESGTITDAVFETYETRLMKAGATIEARRASVKIAQNNLDYTSIRAPFDGTVITKIAEIGDIVAPFASSASSRGAVVTLADMRSLEVEADVSESNIQKVKIDQPCEIVLDAFNDIRYQGYVKNIVKSANRSAATIRTRIAFNKLDSLIYPEMAARVYFLSTDNENIEVEEPSFVGISSRAIVEDEDDNQFVFVIIEDYVEKRKIETGKTIGRMVEVLSGVEVDDQLVQTPSRRLMDGDKIRISD